MKYSIRRTESARLIPPTDAQIKEEAEKAGLRFFNPDLVRDMAEIAAGGELLPIEEVEARVKNAVPDLVVRDGKRYKSPVVVTADRYQCEEETRTKLLQHEAAIRGFLEAAKPQLRSREGTPLMRAILLLKALQEEGAKNAGEGIAIPVFSQMQEKAARQDVEQLFEMMSGDQAGQPVDFYDLEVVEIEEIARQLDAHAQFRAKASKKIVEDVDGEDVLYRGMAKYAEIGSAVPLFWALPSRYRTYKMARKAVTVRRKATLQKGKQLLGLLVDVSGSMDSGNRIKLALGVAANRANAVIRGEAVLVVQFFAGGLIGEPELIDDKEKAQQLIKKLRNEAFDGGGTNIDGAVREFVENISTVEGERPEVCIVTDGDDFVPRDNLKKFLEEKKFVLHAFVVEEHNDDLCWVAEQTGGLAINGFRKEG